MPDSHSRPPMPTASPSREEIARLEVGHTTITPTTAAVLVACFLAAMVVAPLVEVAGTGRLRAEGVETAWSRVADLPGAVWTRLTHASAPAVHVSLWNRVVTANRTVLESLSEFERALEHESLLGRSLRPPAQAVLSGWLGAGNERVYCGRDGWLFYRPDVDYLTGPGFLDPAQLRRRIAGASEWATPPHPDPREAIRRFQRGLESRGIRLVIVPTPLKPGVHPERLAAHGGGTAGVLQNPSFQTFVEAVTRDGVLVFDPSETLAAARHASAQYLATDTHWRPEAMEAAAEALANFIVARVPLPVTADPGYRLERSEVRHVGDIARMLDLPEDSALFPPETVWLRRVLQPDGSAWRPSREADVLLLGDSFSNVYALESMGWGTSAGLAEQLSYALRRPVDRLVQNDDGAYATRALLRQDPGRLEGKRVVVWQFAARELAFGDWKVIPVPDGP